MNNGFQIAKILSRRTASSTVVVLELEILTKQAGAAAAANSTASSIPFTFQPGQWVDFVVPPYDWVGGFSMASLPRELPRMQLAVKRSSHAPAQWVHSEESFETGREVHLKVGGNCILNQEKIPSQVVFCAGGIGISPLLSMYRFWTEFHQQKRKNNKAGVTEPSAASASFFYSVSTEDELVFIDELTELAKTNNSHEKSGKNHELILTLTQQEEWRNLERKSILESLGVECRTGRWMKEFLQQADPTSHFYLCGPPAMLDTGVDLLQNRNIDKKHIHFEKWW
jgi:propane monooxygenase reductase subunit